MQNCESLLKEWLKCELGNEEYSLQRLPGDASFRTYYRVRKQDQSYIVMLAPPGKENTCEFVTIARAWYQVGLQVPHILGWEQKAGFVLMSDFGDRLMLDLLNEQTVEHYYPLAFEPILKMQSIPLASCQLPLYDEAFVGLELSYFDEWFVDKLLNVTLSAPEIELLLQVNNHIIHNFYTLAQRIVHRDYHSRNLMVLKDASLGVIDFQDAMIGPITYDLVSLLKDCYIAWPREKVIRWVGLFFEKLVGANKAHSCEFDLFLQGFDWVGLQRHLKVLGIFSRLKLRDHKSHYLQHIPRIMDYVLAVTAEYPALSDFNHFLQIKILPPLRVVLEQQNIEIDSKIRVA